MFKVEAFKDGKKLNVERLDVNKDGHIYALWHRPDNSLTWDFTKDLTVKIAKDISVPAKEKGKKKK
jgi:hypothetical protein